ncbi:SUR7-domain-containing protein [Lindgomyces ingoldianus]|uniref:SUR7-domain-containing protein n=1 Tax=Lindgomyces ingoldianus TaxID=673940 RepID=A0ACB6RE34_9PLEO|nr:SUR7-domain-containing protein [Lindgomyces ingoldianus]KAF2477300.1 SUR7-domain-containing protein [Lindgomyces ingoldianus]
MTFGLLPLIILTGGILLQFFTILSGAINSSPVTQFFFLEASNIGNIPNARNPSRWTFFAICGVNPSNGHNANCGSLLPALPFDPPRNFGTDDNIPNQFIRTHQYYYLSRFMFGFYLMALFFAVVALFTGVLALCSRLGGYLSGLTTAVALLFQTLAASLMTAWTVQGRDAFRSGGHSAKLGVKLYAFTWSAMACFLLSTVLFCCGGAVGRGSTSVRRKRPTRSSRSRGSFLDTESQRRVKDDYS